MFSDKSFLARIRTLGHVGWKVIASYVLFSQGDFEDFRLAAQLCQPITQRSHHVLTAGIEITKVEDNRGLPRLLEPFRRIVDRRPSIIASPYVERDPVVTDHVNEHAR